MTDKLHHSRILVVCAYILILLYLSGSVDYLLETTCRLAVVFLAFDVFFAVFCIVLACIIGVALFCCLPCIVAILYAVTGQEGASDVDLNELPKFRFRPATRSAEFDPVKEPAMAITITEEESMDELALLPEDSVSIYANFKMHYLNLFSSVISSILLTSFSSRTFSNYLSFMHRHLRLVFFCGELNLFPW